jgi:hypothetical protein
MTLLKFHRFFNFFQNFLLTGDHSFQPQPALVSVHLEDLVGASSGWAARHLPVHTL